jgi:nicotinate-nucleotide adenylyltransferase
MKPPRRFGLYGGTFDPVHEGHIQFAKEATRLLKLDRLFWVPAAQNPLKSLQPRASAAQRAKMLELALAEAAVPEWELYLGELRRPAPSYTIDTVKDLQSTQEGEWTLLLGSEVFGSLSQWKDPEELKARVRFAVTVRPGEKPPEATSAGPQMALLTIETLDVSSTALRRQISSLFDLPRETAPERLPGLQRSVWWFIKKNRLYAV